MEIRQLRYFVSTVRLGSLKEAARENFVTQPAVTIQLKKLEREIGEKLYVRAGRRIRPTQAGSFLAEYAEEILARVDDLSAGVQQLRGLERGLLCIGNIDAATIYVLPGVFAEFRSAYPGVDIKVVVADSEGLLSALDAGHIELAIVILPLSSESVELTPFYEDTMVLVVDPKHELATDKPRNPLRSVAETGLITYPVRSTTRRLIERVFLENGLTFRAAMEMSSPEAIKRLTEAGLGPSILPLRVVEPEIRRGTLSVVPTGKVTFVRTLGVVYRNNAELSPSAKMFLKMLLGRFRLQRKGSRKKK